jgi:hypothetical protein
VSRRPGHRAKSLLAASASTVLRLLGRQGTQPSGGDSLSGLVGSPGQFGADATRDLTPGELRAMRPSYSPQLDGAPDPGEVVWTWVPYIEHDGRGKDRPVLIIARLRGEAWAACALSTTPHRGFVSVGSGPWDSKGRESFLSPERVLRVTKAGMRRESTALDRTQFEQAVATVKSHHGLS